MGYENFPALWKGELGFVCPVQVQVVVTRELAASGRYPIRETAKAAGLKNAETAKGIIRQLEEGTPPNQVDKVSTFVLDQRAKVASGGTELPTRARAHPRRSGALPNERVPVSISIYKWQADQVDKMARDLGISNVDLYRQFVDQGLAKLGSKPPLGK
jgi:hypothetical protein